MNTSDFRRIALSMEGAEEGSHMGATDFRVGGRIFATLASVKQGYGNLMITPEHQAAFIADRPDLYLPIHCGWGRTGTHIRLAMADEGSLQGALYTAWKLRVEKNEKASGKKAGLSKAHKDGSLTKRATKQTAAAPRGEAKKKRTTKT